MMDDIFRMAEIPIPTVDEIMDDAFSYPNYVNNFLSQDKSNEPVDIDLEDEYVKEIIKIMDMYFLDRIQYGADIADKYTPMLKAKTLNYIKKTSKNSKQESFDRALKYYNGEVELSDIYLDDLIAPIMDGKKSRRLYRLRRVILSKLKYADKDMVTNYTIGELVRRQKR